MEKKLDKKIPKKQSRRKFLKSGTLGIAVVAVTAVAKSSVESSGKKGVKEQKWVMVIDLQKCTGCASCEIACKNENNVPRGFLWASHIIETQGKFPNVRYTHIPTLCNHCEDAPCVDACPTRAMHKRDDNITMHDAKLCIGCKTCGIACPYNVISFNKEKPHGEFRNEKELIKGCTTSGKEVVKKSGTKDLPYYNKDRDETLPGIRPKGVVEKCTFCDHRVKNGKLPYCVDACPCNARVFGDLNDPKSEVSQILKKFRPLRLKEHLGTKPSVFYIRDYNPTTYPSTKGSI